VSGSGNGARDWTQLSRKHALDIDAPRGRITIFGGKLTDSLNVGEEICAEARRLGVVLPYPRRRWFGEPSKPVRDEYFHQANLMALDALTSPQSTEKLSSRLWRRYGGEALGLLEAIRRDPRQADVIIETSEYIRCELDEAARREMVVKLADFLRRRSKIALVVRREEIRAAPGLREACRILFGEDQIEAKIEEYFGREAPAWTRTRQAASGLD
jgi:glycerol-3-phosphate dehydrogenase